MNLCVQCCTADDDWQTPSAGHTLRRRDGPRRPPPRPSLTTRGRRYGGSVAGTVEAIAPNSAGQVHFAPVHLVELGGSTVAAAAAAAAAATENQGQRRRRGDRWQGWLVPWLLETEAVATDGSPHGRSSRSQSLSSSRRLPDPVCPGFGPLGLPPCQGRAQGPTGGSGHGRSPGNAVVSRSLPVVGVPGQLDQLFSPCTGMFTKKLTHLFYYFHGTKRCKDEFADTKR